MEKQETKTATLTSQTVDNGQAETKPVKYVVVRDGHRVSDREYDTPDDPGAVKEKEFWSRVNQKHPYGKPAEIVRYDSKRHRVW